MGQLGVQRRLSASSKVTWPLKLLEGQDRMTTHTARLVSHHSNTFGLASMVACLLNFFVSLELDKNWLTDPSIIVHAKRGMVVQLKGTRGDGGMPNWSDGAYEGQTGTVESVTDSQSEHLSTVAVIQMDKSPSQTLTVPVQYLVPVPPNGKGDEIVALDGKFKGHRLKVMERGVGWVVSVDGGNYDDIPDGRCVLIRQ